MSLDLANQMLSSGMASLPPAVRGSTATGAAVDCGDAGLGLTSALLNVGTVTGTGTLTVTITECDTSGGSYSAISGATFTVVSATPSPAGSIEIINFIRTKRYLKAVATIVETSTPSFPCSVTILAQKRALGTF